MPTSKVPLWFKLSYSAFCVVLIAIYLRDYGPTNFLYFCDVAIIAGLFATWLEIPLMASLPAVGILIPQFRWVIDLSLTASGLPATGTTAYLFSQKIPLFTRALSFQPCLAAAGGRISDLVARL